MVSNYTHIISSIGILVTITIFIMTNYISNKKEFIKTLDEIYKKTFSLKTNITKIAEEKNHIEFHYEIDSILNTKEIEVAVLDYLTEIENLSLIVIKRNNIFYRKLFKKLVSPELYKRLLCLYPYIVYKQRQSKNENLFSNYINLILEIEKIKIDSNKNLMIYSGIRESDIEYDEDYFADKLCLFRNEYDNSFREYRANQNYNKSDYTDFYALQFISLNKKWTNNSYKIMFYNQNNVFELHPKLREHAVCFNRESILLLLNDKVAMKQFLKSQGITIPNYVVVNGLKLKDNSIFDKIKSEQFIIQSVHGGGGIGTYLFDKKTFNLKKDQLEDTSKYIVSNYISNSISVNVHVFISESTNLITPASVQLIENIENQLMYRGADFISFRELDIDIQEKIRCTSIKISNALRDEGYRGVTGIDYIIDNKKNIYCSEINPRFQASSILLSKYLNDRKIDNPLPTNKLSEDLSIYSINYHSFDNIVKSSISFYDKVNYSCYFYYNDEELNMIDIKIKIEAIKSSCITESLRLDGLFNFTENKMNKNSYLFRAIYNVKISQISPDNELWINDNIRISKYPASNNELKIALLNQGVRIDKIGKFKKAVFSGVDFQIKNSNMFVNCPVNLLSTDLSPFMIKQINKKYFLYFLSSVISEVSIEEEQVFIETTPNADKIKDIVYLSTDRIRIKPINGCDYKGLGLGCKFCELKYSREHYTLDEIFKAIEYCKSLNFEHVLIGGGTDLSKDSWTNIINIANKVRESFPNKPISLMSIPIPTKYLKKIHEAGINEVAYNIEIHDAELANKYMPGKRDHNYDVYLKKLKEAVDEFGVGNVRSAFVVGLENTQSLLEGIRDLCEINVIPCLSIYRKTDNTIENINPTNKYLEDIYCKASQIVEEYDLILGPKCEKCKNNMLSF